MITVLIFAFIETFLKGVDVVFTSQQPNQMMVLSMRTENEKRKEIINKGNLIRWTGYLYVTPL